MSGDVNSALPYWEGLAGDGLFLPWCEPCHRHLPLGVGVCHGCGALSTGWRRSTGVGTVWSYTVVRRSFFAAAPWPPPYVVALIDLAEGPRVPGALVGVNETDVRVGLRVTLAPGTDESGDPVLAFQSISAPPQRGDTPGRASRKE